MREILAARLEKLEDLEWDKESKVTKGGEESIRGNKRE